MARLDVADVVSFLALGLGAGGSYKFFFRMVQI